MRVTAMSEVDALEHFGKSGPLIVRLSREAAALGASRYVPPPLGPGQCLALQERYGPNGVSVHLLMQVWKSIPWRARDEKPSKRDSEVTRLADWGDADREAPSWKSALLEAGYRTSIRVLHQVWEDAGAVGFELGSHHARELAGATCGELAQLTREREPHFFIDMMPWLIEGYWTCGWDEQRGRLQVL